MSSFDAKAVESVLAAWKPLGRRAAATKVSLKDVERAYGDRLSDDLRTLIALHERRVLPALRGGWHLLRESKTMAPPKKLSVSTDLMPSLCALYPLADRGEDRAYATLRPGAEGLSWVYFYEGMESGALTHSHYSVAHFVWTHTRAGDDYDDLFGTDDKTSNAFVARERIRKLAAVLDPVALQKRSWWLIDALRDGNITAHLSKARSLSEWRAERDLLDTAPHLALYWLLAHWLLQNEGASREADALVRDSSNAWVQAARGWVKGAPPPIAVELRGEAPPRALEKRAAPPAPTSRPTSDDPVATMASAPSDLKLHAKVLARIATSSDAMFREQVKTYQALVAGMSNFHKDKAVQIAWVRAIDERMLIPAIGLVQRSFRFPSWKSEHALRYVIGALGRLGPSSPHRQLALSTLLSADVTKLDANRLAEVANALRPFADPRAAPWLLRCAKAGLADRLGAWSEAATFAALDTLATLDRAKVESLLAALLPKRSRDMLIWHGVAADVARLHAMTALAPALAAAFGHSDWGLEQTGMALAVLTPATAKKLVFGRAKKEDAAPERPAIFKDPKVPVAVAGTVLRLPRRERAVLVSTLLVLDRTDAQVLVAAKTLLRRKETAPKILRALAAARASEQLPLVRRYLRSPDHETSEAAEDAVSVLASTSA